MIRSLNGRVPSSSKMRGKTLHPPAYRCTARIGERRRRHRELRLPPSAALRHDSEVSRPWPDQRSNDTSPGFQRNTFLLALSSLFADISTEMFYPVLPSSFMTQTLKARAASLAGGRALAQATQNIVQGFSGALSDKLQKRKSIALVGYLLAAVAKPLMGLSTVWQGVFGARLLDRLGAGTRSAPRDALVRVFSGRERQGQKPFGLEGFGDNAGAFLGPLLAVLLLYALHVGIRTIFYLAIIPGLLAFFMVLLVKERHAVVAAKSKIDVSLRQFPKGYWQYLLVIALFGLGSSSNSFLICGPRISASLWKRRS